MHCNALSTAVYCTADTNAQWRLGELRGSRDQRGLSRGPSRELSRRPSSSTLLCCTSFLLNLGGGQLQGIPDKTSLEPTDSALPSLELSAGLD